MRHGGFGIEMLLTQMSNSITLGWSDLGRELEYYREVPGEAEHRLVQRHLNLR